MPGRCILAVSREATPEKLAKLSIEKASFSLKREEFKEAFLAVGEDFACLQREKLLYALEREFFTVFSRSPSLTRVGGRQEESEIFTNLPDAVNLL